MSTYYAEDGDYAEVQRVTGGADVLLTVASGDGSWPDVGSIQIPIAELRRLLEEATRPTLPRKCPGCSTAPASHIPGSDECEEARRERDIAQSDV